MTRVLSTFPTERWFFTSQKTRHIYGNCNSARCRAFSLSALAQSHTLALFTRGDLPLLSASSIIRADIASKDQQSGTRSNSHVESVHRSVIIGPADRGPFISVFFAWQNVGSAKVVCSAGPVSRIEKKSDERTSRWLMQRVIKARHENHSEPRGTSLKTSTWISAVRPNVQRRTSTK